ncbi:MAG TPA: DUF255 domain-containing protein [Reyranella sp.]|nr:DUF255 domain-containing protein [Reyranella sp.]
MASTALAAPLDNKDGFWSEWSEATFERAAHEQKFVIVSLQSWWCPWCLTMNRETWADPEVRAELKDHFIPVMSTKTAGPTSRSATSAGAGPRPSSSARRAARS